MNPARSAAFVVVSQVTKLALSVVGLVTVSRLLTPLEFGLFAMVTAVLGVGDIFRDFGLSMAAIRAKTLSKHEQSNLFWMNLAIGGVLSGIFAALSPIIAGLYGQPTIALLVVAMAGTFMVNGAAAQFRVELVRRDRFSALTVTDVGSAALALGTAISLALAGAGVWALAAQAVAQSVVALTLVVAQVRWKPGLPNRQGDIRPMLGFGANLLGTQVLSYMGRNVDNVLLGRFWGATALGYYSKAFTLYSMPQQQALAPFTDLALRTLSGAREHPELYAARIAKMQLVANYVALAMFGLLIALADQVVAIVLGPSWQETAVLLRILSVGGIFQLLGNVYYWIFLTEGLAGLHLRISLFAQPAAVICIVVGLPFGAPGVAWGAAAGLFIEWLVPATIGARRTSVSAAWLLRNTVRPTLFCIGLAVSAHFSSLIGNGVAIIGLAGGLLGGALWTVVAIALWPMLRADLAQIVGLVPAALARRSRVETATVTEVETEVIRSPIG